MILFFWVKIIAMDDNDPNHHSPQLSENMFP